MYGIVLGVTPPGALRKMNQDNNCLFNANIMNKLMHDHVCYDYDHEWIHVWLCKEQEHGKLLDKYKICIEHVKNVILMMILGFP
jgi:hypothetical protein